MKRKLFIISVCCLIAAKSLGQVLIGFTYGIGAYQWDRFPVENSTKTIGGLFSEIVGLNVGAGDETFRFVLEGYEEYAPFEFSIEEFQGMGTFSAGALAKLSLTPFEERYGSDRHGFSIGAGIETTYHELHFRNEDVSRNWNPTKYGYIAYTKYIDKDNVPVQQDIFCKVGIGSHSSMRIELGIRWGLYLFFPN
jgi:hypothetical protein